MGVCLLCGVGRVGGVLDCHLVVSVLTKFIDMNRFHPLGHILSCLCFSGMPGTSHKVLSHTAVIAHKDSFT